MRKLVVLGALLLALLGLSACAKKQEAPKADLETLYQRMLETEGMPDMLTVPADQAEYIFGIMQSDCSGAITAICADSLQADDDYLPDQYLIVQKGRVIRSGDRVCLLVSPQIDKLAELLG